MGTHWGIDLGTSNTTVCEDRSGRPRPVYLPRLAKHEPITQTPVVPTAICVMEDRGPTVLIGNEALEYNWDGLAPGFAHAFKRYVGTAGHRPVARVGRLAVTAHEAMEHFLRALIHALEEECGERVENVTVATPSGFYEAYRAALQEIARRIDRPSLWRRILARVLGRAPRIQLRTLDEPVAAALGYGVDLGRDVTLVAFDFGAGSMEAAALRCEGAKTVQSGQARVLAKQAIELGGNDVDAWILERFLPSALRAWPEQEVALRWEAEKVKLLASAGSEGTFTFRSRTYGRLEPEDLRGLLAERGLYDRIRELLEALLRELGAEDGAASPDSVDEVIMEGGSTLLPGVRDVIGEVLGRHRIREWLPFEAVARGACIYAGGARVEDFIYHDYAVRVMRDGERDVEYELLIPGGTRYPTAADLVTRYYAAGFDGQQEINLFVCEVGRVAGQRVNWEERSNGTSVFAPGTRTEQAFCVCLNESDPAVPLSPPGNGDAPRLRVTFAVDEGRWLRVSVHDLLRKTDLAARRQVVRLR